MIELHADVVFLTRFTHRVIFRGRGDGQEHADVFHASRVFLDPRDGAHEFHTTDFRIRDTGHHFIDQGKTLTGVNVLELAGFQIFHIRQAARLHVTDRLFAGIAGFIAMHFTSGNQQCLTPLCALGFELANPPFIIYQTRNAGER